MQQGLRVAIAEAQQRALVGALPWLAWGLAAFYSGLGLYWLLALQGAYPVLGLAWAASGVAFAAVALLRARRTTASTDAAFRAAALLAALVVADSVALLAVTKEPAMSVALFLTVLGFALIVPSRPILMGVAAAGWAGFIAVVVAAPDREWSVRAITFAAVTVVAFIAQQVRLLSLERLALLNETRVEQARSEQALQLLRREADFKAAFIRLAAHELATPLTPVVLQTRVLAQDPGFTGRHRTAIERLERNVTRLERIVLDLLVLARQAGAAAFDPKPIDLRQVLEAEAGLARAAAIAAGVEVRAREAASPVMAHADLGHVSTAVRRLLDNAVKFTPRGGTIELEARQDGAWAEVRVLDTGPGVDPRRAPRIFEPFEKAADPHESDPGGPGIGLAVVREVAVAHGGQALHEARAGGGSIFTLRLPRIDDTARVAPAA